MMQFPTTTPEQMFERSISFFGRCAGLQAVGIASFGPVDVRTGRIMSTPKVGWANIEITRVFRSALNVPVGFGADSDAAAMAEMKWGAAQELPTGLVVLVGTGITGSVILDGRVVHGAAPSEIGHIRVPHDLTRDPFPGVCPYHGDCLEGLASGPAVEARWGVFPATLPPNHPAWALEAHYLALAVHNWICELSPQRIVFGGGLMQQAALWDIAGDEGIMGQRRPFGLIREEVGRLLNGYTRNCDLVTSAVKYKGAVLLGALLLAKSALVAEYH
jgi:fructokinase